MTAKVSNYFLGKRVLKILLLLVITVLVVVLGYSIKIPQKALEDRVMVEVNLYCKRFRTLQAWLKIKSSEHVKTSASSRTGFCRLQFWPEWISFFFLTEWCYYTFRSRTVIWNVHNRTYYSDGVMHQVKSPSEGVPDSYWAEPLRQKVVSLCTPNHKDTGYLLFQKAYTEALKNPVMTFGTSGWVLNNLLEPYDSLNKLFAGHEETKIHQTVLSDYSASAIKQYLQIELVHALQLQKNWLRLLQPDLHYEKGHFFLFRKDTLLFADSIASGELDLYLAALAVTSLLFFCWYLLYRICRNLKLNLDDRASAGIILTPCEQPLLKRRLDYLACTTYISWIIIARILLLPYTNSIQVVLTLVGLLSSLVYLDLRRTGPYVKGSVWFYLAGVTSDGEVYQTLAPKRIVTKESWIYTFNHLQSLLEWTFLVNHISNADFDKADQYKLFYNQVRGRGYPTLIYFVLYGLFMVPAVALLALLYGHWILGLAFLDLMHQVYKGVLFFVENLLKLSILTIRIFKMVLQLTLLIACCGGCLYLVRQYT